MEGRFVRAQGSSCWGGVTSRTSFVASVAQWTESGCPVEILSDEEPLVRHVQRHVVPRIAGVESVADVTQIVASEVNLVEAGREFAVASVSEDVLDALEADLGPSDRYCGASAEQVCHSRSH